MDAERNDGNLSAGQELQEQTVRRKRNRIPAKHAKDERERRYQQDFWERRLIAELGSGPDRNAKDTRADRYDYIIDQFRGLKKQICQSYQGSDEALNSWLQREWEKMLVPSGVAAEGAGTGAEGVDDAEFDLPELDLSELDLPELDLSELDLIGNNDEDALTISDTAWMSSLTDMFPIV